MSSSVTALSASRSAVFNSFGVRGWRPRTKVLTFDQQFSIGERVRRVSGQPQDLCFNRSDGLLNLTGMMHWQVIQHHNVFGLQLRDQSLINISIKDHRINGAFKREWREQSAQTQTPDQRDSPSLIARHALLTLLPRAARP